jgi:hypothetical protein
VILTVPAVLLTLTLVAFLLRRGALRLGPAIAAARFGFFLAGTGVGPAIRTAISAGATALSQIGF